MTDLQHREATANGIRMHYVEQGDGYVMPPGVKRGAEWEKVVEWTADFARALRDAARAHVGEKDAIAG